MTQTHPEHDPLLGRTVADRYVVQSRIGSGGMGTVYRATQTGLGRAVALKLLREEVSWDPDTITRFHREAKAMSLLVHPNTVRVFDFGQTPDGTLYLAMELLEGDLLTQRIEADGGMSPPLAIRIVRQILASLHEAHAKGIIHRDLKPDNIFLAQVEGHEDVVVKVLDFGIAKVFEGENQFDQLETQAGTVFGTPRYMSPEQAQGKTLDARSDIYSVGVLLYQMLTGLAPFRDDDAVVVMAKHIRDKPEPPVKVAPERRIPPSLNRAVLKSLEKAPEKRFQDASAFIKALDKCIEDAVAMQRASRTGVFVRTTAQRAQWPWIAAVIILALAVGIAAYFVGSSPDPSPVVVEAAGPPEVPSEPVLVDPSEIEFGELDFTPTVVQSEPSGAEVFIDGELVGRTPYTHELAANTFVELVLRHGDEEANLTLTPSVEPRTVWLRPAEPDVEQTPSAMTTMRRTMRARPSPSEESPPPRMQNAYTMFM
ncbi:MAG: serine/threonine-protein kinase [Myxococcota bacterium]